MLNNVLLFRGTSDSPNNQTTFWTITMRLSSLWNGQGLAWYCSTSKTSPRPQWGGFINKWNYLYPVKKGFVKKVSRESWIRVPSKAGTARTNTCSSTGKKTKHFKGLYFKLIKKKPWARNLFDHFCLLNTKLFGFRLILNILSWILSNLINYSVFKPF